MGCNFWCPIKKKRTHLQHINLETQIFFFYYQSPWRFCLKRHKLKAESSLKISFKRQTLALSVSWAYKTSISHLNSSGQNDSDRWRKINIMDCLSFFRSVLWQDNEWPKGVSGCVFKDVTICDQGLKLRGVDKFDPERALSASPGEYSAAGQATTGWLQLWSTFPLSPRH